MSISVTSYVAELTVKSAKELEEAYLNIPEDKRSWSPDDKGRSANDQMAECAMLAGRVIETISSKVFGSMDFQQYFSEKAQLAATPDAILPLLHKNVEILASTIQETSESDLGVVIDMPWGAKSVSELIIYPYWNMSYHAGQINYIASLLGCLK